MAGGTNGGIWRTTSCTADIPNWMPIADSLPSLSVGDMVYDQMDITYNTVLIGVGTRSSFSDLGGPGVGLYYSQNVMSNPPTWTLLDNAAGDINFKTNGVKFNSVFVRENLILGAAYKANEFNCDLIGIFRSTGKFDVCTYVNVHLIRLIDFNALQPLIVFKLC